MFGRFQLQQISMHRSIVTWIKDVKCRIDGQIIENIMYDLFNQHQYRWPQIPELISVEWRDLASNIGNCWKCCYWHIKVFNLKFNTMDPHLIWILKASQVVFHSLLEQSKQILNAYLMIISLIEHKLNNGNTKFKGDPNGQ